MQRHEYMKHLASRYPGVDEDPMRAMMGALRRVLVAGDYGVAGDTFIDILGFIRKEGFKGKHIRYARKELTDIADEYNHESGHDRKRENKRRAVLRMTKGFAESLPGPRVNGRKSYTSGVAGNEGNGQTINVRVYLSDVIRDSDVELRGEFIAQVGETRDLALFFPPKYLQLGYGALKESVERGVPPDVAVKAFVDVDLSLPRLVQILEVIEKRR